jgi:hypothetical protein
MVPSVPQRQTFYEALSEDNLYSFFSFFYPKSSGSKAEVRKKFYGNFAADSTKSQGMEFRGR